MSRQFADIIIPVALPGSFTYEIPEALQGSVHRGSLVNVPFGQSRNTAGLVVKVHDILPAEVSLREIGSLLPGGLAVNDRLTDFLL